MAVFTILEYPWKYPITFPRNHCSSSGMNNKRHSHLDIHATFIFASSLQLSYFSLEKHTHTPIHRFNELNVMLSVLYTNDWQVKWKDKRLTFQMYYTFALFRSENLAIFYYTWNIWKGDLHFYECFKLWLLIIIIKERHLNENKDMFTSREDSHLLVLHIHIFLHTLSVWKPISWL